MSSLVWGWTNKSATKEEVISDAPKGWHKIVDKLIDDLFAAGWDGTIYQVKEKFGGLRFYAGPTTEEMDKLIRQAEHLSYKTCDVCGEPGTSSQNKHGWIATRCEKHSHI